MGSAENSRDGPPSANVPVMEYKLGEDQELRFEVPTAPQSRVVIEVVEGTAEIFGAELVKHKRYTLGPGSRIGLFTWHGAKVELAGITETEPYVAKATPMLIYLNTHGALEQLRQAAEAQAVSSPEARGPRLMIAGPTDVGKSTYCKVLLNYALRQGRAPVFVDLDVGQNSISLPGTMGALFLERPGDPVSGFEKKAPLVYNFGHTSPGGNIMHFELLVLELAEAVNEKCKAVKEANFGGLIINTCGWVKGEGYTCLVKAAEAFEVDVVIVLDHERLYNELQRDLPNFVRISHQPKSGGVETRSSSNRAASRRKRVREYFYGIDSNPLHPFRFEVPFDEVQIWKVGAEAVPESCLPLGMKPEDHRTKVVPVPITPSLQHHVLGVSFAEASDPKLGTTNVAGFVVVLDVNKETNLLTLLSPQPHPLPGKSLSFSQLTFDDEP